MGTIEDQTPVAPTPPPPRRTGGHAVVGRLGERREHRLALRGRFELAGAGAVWDELRGRTAALTRGDHVALDLSGVEAIDGGTMALLVHLRAELATRGVVAELVDGDERVQALVHLYAGDSPPAPQKRRRHEGFFAQVGRATIEVVLEVKHMLAFLGAVVRAFTGLLREPRTGNWRDVFPQMEKTGIDAVPIVLLINFLVGLVLAYQASTQLRQFGANLYVADLVAASMTREMGPLMTAIILCGRSGAAFAAELGSMKVCEEIDALRTMGFGPVRYLVLPRMVALILVMPVLTLFADAIGIIGGLAVGVHTLDLTPIAYFHRLQSAIELSDVLTGLVKSAAFAAAIAIVSCQQGFAASGGAEGVGRRTTASVVTILLCLILLDAGFTVFFHAFGL